MNYDTTAEGEIIQVMTDETRAAWWWLFQIYGADKALILGRKWGVEA